MNIAALLASMEEKLLLHPLLQGEKLHICAGGGRNGRGAEFAFWNRRERSGLARALPPLPHCPTAGLSSLSCCAPPRCPRAGEVLGEGWKGSGAEVSCCGAAWQSWVCSVLAKGHLKSLALGFDLSQWVKSQGKPLFTYPLSCSATWEQHLRAAVCSFLETEDVFSRMAF